MAVITSSPWGFRFFKLPDYAAALKKIGIDKLCLMAGEAGAFPQTVSGGVEGGKLAAEVLAANGCSALEVAIRKEEAADIELAAATGAEYVRICEIWEHTQESFEAMTSLVSEVGRRAADRNLTVIVENHGGLLADSDDCIRFFERINLPNVTLNYDAANFLHYGGEDPVAALKKCAPFIGFAHLKNVSEAGFGKGVFCRIADGVIDYSVLMPELLKRFHGPLCLEYEMPDDAEKGTQDDFAELKKIIALGGK